MHHTIDPRQPVEKEKLETVLEKFDDRFEAESVFDLRDKGDIQLARLLVIPESKDPIDHTRDLSLVATNAYKANSTRMGDLLHAAARALASYYGFDWKDDIIDKQEERIGELD